MPTAHEKLMCSFNIAWDKKDKKKPPFYLKLNIITCPCNIARDKKKRSFKEALFLFRKWNKLQIS